MSKIILKEPDGPHKCLVFTETMDVEIRECFLGVRFMTDSGEILSVSMRDNGFEVKYHAEFDDGKGFDTGMLEFKNGVVTFPDSRRGVSNDEPS